MAALDPTATRLRTDFLAVFPFWLTLTFIPVLFVAGWATSVTGKGWWLALVPAYGWYLMSMLDFIGGLNTQNPDTETPASDMRWYTAVTLVWPFLQIPVIFGSLYFVTNWDVMTPTQEWVFMACVGIPTGTVGINFAHELMHQRSKLERTLGDVLMTSVLYGHFRSEHLLVHHRHVGTPRDPVTARYNEGFHRFFPRVLKQCLVSSWYAESAMLARKGLTVWHLSNPFWRYAAWQAGWLVLAAMIGGWTGVGMFVLQAFVAIWQLELVNYVEHYGLTRKHLGNGKYEHVLPRHSWNASHRVSNWLLINPQRHSDHHYKPARKFPLLQTYSEDDAPQLPYGYPVMTIMAMIPPVFKRFMNPKVRAWRRRYYPEVTDWQPYNKAQNPVPD